MANKVTFQYNKQQNCPIIFSRVPWHPPNPQALANHGVKYYRYKTTHGYLKILMCTYQQWPTGQQQNSDTRRSSRRTADLCQIIY